MEDTAALLTTAGARLCLKEQVHNRQGAAALSMEVEAILEACKQARSKPGENGLSPDVEHPFGTIKSMGSTHFQMKTLRTSAWKWPYTSSLHMKRVTHSGRRRLIKRSDTKSTSSIQPFPRSFYIGSGSDSA